MKLLRQFFQALPAPFYALLMDSKYQPQNYHAGVWFLIFVVLEFVSLVLDWVGWHRVGWNRLANAALFACLLCRLALVEYDLEEIKRRSAS